MFFQIAAESLDEPPESGREEVDDVEELDEGTITKNKDDIYLFVLCEFCSLSLPNRISMLQTVYFFNMLFALKIITFLPLLGSSLFDH